MILTLRLVTTSVFLVYLTLSFFTVYILFKSSSSVKSIESTHIKLGFPNDVENWNRLGEKFERNSRLNNGFFFTQKSSMKWPNKGLDFGKQFYKSKSNELNQLSEIYSVEIWGKAAIGLYLWEHILHGKIESKMDGTWSYDFKIIENFQFKFRTGPGVIPTKVPNGVEHLILILNGRSEDKVSFAKMWLDFLPQYSNLRSTILIILGNEECYNDWLIPYTSKAGGLINKTFIVYDTPLVDNIYFYQWPLGVATYRGFPKANPEQLDLENARPYTCNFLGSVYAHSSREKLLNVIQKHNLTQFCFIKGRSEWQPHETKTSLSIYIQSLRLSDLTLNPVGMNSECYRIFEAMQFGSVPVVENVMTPGVCGNSKGIEARAPLRLLKLYKAPVIYINDWLELPDLIRKEQKMTLHEKINRRIKLVEWYENFKLKFKEQLLAILKELTSKR